MMYTVNMTDAEIRRILRKKRKQKLLKRRLIALAVALVIAVGGGMLAGRALGNRSYANEIKSIVNVIGDKPIIKAAAGQLGNKGGEPFWSWYGFNGHVSWCACFVSWCADQCGYIKAGVMPKFSWVDDGVQWFKNRHQWQKRSYKPAPGDIIFFDWECDGSVSHVGIVESCDGRTVHTIEGNSGDACKRQSYSVGSSVIFGYGIPKY